MKNGGGIPPKATLTIRLLIGAYLLYIDYQIFPDVMAREGISKYVMLGIMVFFAIAGAALIIMSARPLLGLGGSWPEDEAASERKGGSVSENEVLQEGGGMAENDVPQEGDGLAEDAAAGETEGGSGRDDLTAKRAEDRRD